MFLNQQVVTLPLAIRSIVIVIVIDLGLALAFAGGRPCLAPGSGLPRSRRCTRLPGTLAGHWRVFVLLKFINFLVLCLVLGLVRHSCTARLGPGWSPGCASAAGTPSPGSPSFMVVGLRLVPSLTRAAPGRNDHGHFHCPARAPGGARDRGRCSGHRSRCSGHRSK